MQRLLQSKNFNENLYSKYKILLNILIKLSKKLFQIIKWRDEVLFEYYFQIIMNSFTLINTLYSYYLS